MCVDVTLVPIPEFLGYPMERFDPAHPEYGIDVEGRKCFAVDSCIVPALLGVWAAGVKTLGCCCGHGQKAGGVISLDTADLGEASPDTETKRRFRELHAGVRPSESGSSK